MTFETWKPIGDEEQPIWEATAAELGLFYKEGTASKPPIITGTIDGFLVKVECTAEREHHAPPKTMYRVTYPSLGDPIRIGRERTIRKVGILRRLIHVHDIEIGDRAFDRLAIIDADDVEAAATFLTESRREIIATVLRSRKMRNVIVSESSTSFDTDKVEHRADRLAGNILGLAQLAGLLARSEAGTDPQAVQLRSFFDDDHSDPSPIQDQDP